MSRRSLAGFTVITALVVGLVGCAPTAVETPEPTATTISTPTPTPARETNGAASIMLTSEKIIALDEEDAVIGEASYFSDPEPAIELLTESFGVEPDVTEKDGSPHALTLSQLDWDGMKVLVFGYGSDLGYAVPVVYVRVSDPEVEGVRVTTRDGISVDALEDAVKPLSYDYKEVERIYLLDEFRVDVQYDLANGLPAYSTQVVMSDMNVAAALTAPNANFGL